MVRYDTSRRDTSNDAGVQRVQRMVFRLSVRDDGIVMYRLNRMTWSDVQSARFRRVVGLPYLHIQRHHGVPLWLPLYFRGVRDLRHVLIERAPERNPIHACLKEFI